MKKLVVFVSAVLLLSCAMFSKYMPMQTKMKALLITDFSAMYSAIYNNLVTNFKWEAGKTGNWIGDWSYDASSFAPGVCFKAGNTADGKATLEYVTKLSSTTQLMEYVTGFASYIYGPAYYPGRDWCGLMNLGVAVGVNEAKKVSTPIGDAAGYIVGLSSVSYMGYRMANTCLYAAMATKANEAFDQMNVQYWHQELGYYFDATPGHQGGNCFSSFQNGSAFSALAWHYGIYKDQASLDKMGLLRGKAEQYLWNTTEGGYRDKENYLGQDLGANVLWCRGYLWAYWVTGDLWYLNKAFAILQFVQAYLFMADPDHINFFIASHDWYPIRGPATNYCTGCNFLLLDCIYDYNAFKASGPLSGAIPIAPATQPGCSVMGD